MIGVESGVTGGGGGIVGGRIRGVAGGGGIGVEIGKGVDIRCRAGGGGGTGVFAGVRGG